ncbi:NAD(P)H-quinone oxidoreductase [Aspergillus candidus]|uniref:Chaperonin 10-like protein n=1 Tax=Aspergillus candidus TaxID=41067 RepID=A0A2I2F633_ASPCN|nr:chaperonin 10-like protein [Aspergillus candidus]PLB36097.1 chaperonin 10-like protein [Aspergillus candidus]
MAHTMRAIDVRPGGTPAGLFINPSAPKPVPSPNECLVRVKTFGLNRGDTLQREGRYPPPAGITNIMGLEFAGVIEEIGSDGHPDEGLEKWKKGDEVFGLLYGGGYAEFVVVDKRMLIAKTKELSWVVCGGLCEVWFTALQALHLVAAYDAKRVKSILWHAGGSSVSIAGIQLSLAAHEYSVGEGTRAEPPKVFATARSDAKCEMCVKKLGCTAAVNPTSMPDWAAGIKKLNDGNGIDIIFDFVGGGAYFPLNLGTLALDGTMVSLGLLGGPTVPGPVDISPIIMKRLRVEGSTLRTRSLDYQICLRDLFVEKVLPKLVDGRFQHVVDHVFEWEKIGEAHQMLENNATTGKVVCAIDSYGIASLP